MNRKDFLKSCSLTCLTLAGFAGVISSCRTSRRLQVNASQGRLIVPRSEFLRADGERRKYYESLVVHSDSAAHPTVIFRGPDNSYRAFPLKCTHQGAELSVNGNVLTCSAHGSEFSSEGAVLQGPAEQALQPYPVTVDAEKLIVHLP